MTDRFRLTKLDSNPKRKNPFTAPMEKAKRQKQARASQHSDYVERFQQALAKFANACALCSLGEVDSSKHTVFDCPQLREMGCDTHTYREWKRDLVYDSKLHNKVCWKCHIPQIGDELHATFGSGPCEHQDVVGPIAYGILNTLPLRLEAEAHFQVTWEDLDDFVQWLNGAPVAGHRTNMSALFLWYCNK